jgi:quercetin 2,3-dioxygenase
MGEWTNARIQLCRRFVALPRVPELDPTAVDRPVVSVTTAPSGFEGEGFPVRRAFAGVDLRALDPFVHMDQMGEVDYAPGEPKGTPWHPHRLLAADVHE